MGVYIRGMKVPESCDVCPFMKTNDNLMSDDPRYMYCDFPGIGEFVADCIASRLVNCPLIPVPDHGDLIDRDLLLELAFPLKDQLFGGEYRIIKESHVRSFPAIIIKERNCDIDY